MLQLVQFCDCCDWPTFDYIKLGGKIVCKMCEWDMSQNMVTYGEHKE